MTRASVWISEVAAAHARAAAARAYDQADALARLAAIANTAAVESNRRRLTPAGVVAVSRDR